MKKILAFWTLIFCLLLLTGCKESSSDSTTTATPPAATGSYSGSGVVQGGPPQIGSVVTAHCMEFNPTLGEYQSTGISFTAETSDMYGKFSFSNISCPIAKFAFTGFIFNEVTNTYEQTAISMLTLIDVSASTSYSINPLSSMVKGCIETRRAAGDTDDQAKDYAELKLLQQFGITTIENPEFDEMDLGGSSAQDIAHVMITTNLLRDGKNNRSMQEFTQFLAQFSTDFKDCVIDSPTITSTIRNTARYLPIDSVVTNLTNFYAGGGQTFHITAAQIKEYAYKTDTVKPTVASIVPATGATGIGKTSNIVITFDMPIKPDMLTFGNSTVCTGTVQVSDGSGCVPITANSLNADKEVLTLTATLDYAKTYTVKLDPALQSVSGNAFDSASLMTLGSFSTIAWAGTQQFGTSGDDIGYGLALDSSGNVLVTGHEGADSFVAKYSATGVRSWKQTLDLGSTDYADSIVLDLSGNIYLAGASNAGGDYDVFTAKYNELATIQAWKSDIGAHLDNLPTGIAVDGSGNVFSSSWSNSNTGLQDFYSHTADFSDSGLFAKYNSSGVKQWAGITGSGDNLETEIHGIAVDGSGNIYLCGSTQGALTGANAGSDDSFLVKFDSAHNVTWTKQPGTASSDKFLDLVVDGSGNIFVAGFSGTGLTLMKYNSAGTQSWSKSATLAKAYALALDSAGNVYVTGQDSAGKILVKKFDSAGTEVSSAVFGAGIGHDIVVNSSNKAYIVGYTTDGLDGNSNAGGKDIFLMQY